MAEVQREKQSELREAYFLFQDYGGRLQKCLERMVILGNKLSDDSGNLKEGIHSESPSPRLPGMVSDFHITAEQYGSLIRQIELQLDKLETQI